VALRLVFVVALGWGVFGMMLADVVVSAVLLAGLLPVAGRPAAWRCSWRLARELLRYGSPRVPHALLRQTLGQADRFLLRLYLPVTQVGVYGAGATVANTLSIFREAFRRAWMPLAFERMSDGDAPRLFARLATVAFGALAFCTLGLTLFAAPLIRWLTPPEYHGAVHIAPVLAAGVAIHALTVFLTTSLNISKQTGPLPWATGAGAFVTIAANVVLIPLLGMPGAALATVAGSVTLVAALAVAAQRHYPIPYELGRLARIAATGGVLYAVSQFGPQDASLVDVLLRAALLAAFPVALLAVGVLDRGTIAQARRLLARGPQPGGEPLS
jgi:O-antigen/teichoic acid export membrane protein